MALHTRFAAFAALALMTGACAHQTREARVITPPPGPPPAVVAVQRTALPPMDARVTPPPRAEAAPTAQPVGWSVGGQAAPQACTGDYTVRDARTGRLVASGRARKDGVLLVEVLASGRDGRRFGSHWTADPARGPSPYQVLFLPDCKDGTCAAR